MKYDFDKIIDRKGSGAIKYDWLSTLYGSEDAIPLWVADMDFASPPSVVEAIVARATHPVYGYTQHTDAFFNAIITWYRKRHLRTIERDWILFTPGIVPALSFVVQALTEEGDKVVVQPPVYFPFFNAITDHNRICLRNNLKYKEGRYSMDLEELASLFEREHPALFILSSPHNPVGRVWTKEELLKLGQLCVKYGVFLLSDEIHADLIFPPSHHEVFLGLDDAIDDHLIVTSSPSKTFNIAGLATSYLIIKDKNIRAKIQTVFDSFHIQNGNIFGTTALEAAYNKGEDWLEELLMYLAVNKEYIINFARERMPKIHILPCEATYLLWLDFSAYGLTKEELVARFNNVGLALSEGGTFGENGAGFMRLNFAMPLSIIKEVCEKMLIAFS